MQSLLGGRPAPRARQPEPTPAPAVRTSLFIKQKRAGSRQKVQCARARTAAAASAVCHGVDAQLAPGTAGHSLHVFWPACHARAHLTVHADRPSTRCDSLVSYCFGPLTDVHTQTQSLSPEATQLHTDVLTHLPTPLDLLPRWVSVILSLSPHLPSSACVHLLFKSTIGLDATRAPHFIHTAYAVRKLTHSSRRQLSPVA